MNSKALEQAPGAALLRDLKARHLAYLEARLVSAEAESEWRDNAAAVYATLLDARLGDLVDVEALARATSALLTADAVEHAARPVGKHVLAHALRELRAEPGTVGAHLPEAARRKLDRLLERPGLLPDRLLREIVEQDAIEEVMRDMLFDALKEFSEKVNPFVADWGLPALFKKLSPFGVGKGFESMRAEFDRRLEPEIRKFLQGASRRGLHRMVEFTIAKGDEPKFIAVRKNLAAWLLAQEIAALARTTDEGALALAQEIALDTLAHELSLVTTAPRIHALVAEAIEPRRARTIREVLAELGVTFAPEVDVLARATWPIVRAALVSPPVRAWMARVVGAFYDAEIAALTGSNAAE